MNTTLKESNFTFEGQTDVYHGKVRDVYSIGDKIVAIASDRISAFDKILSKPIPYKGQVLNQVAAHFLEATKDIVPNWVISIPDPNVTIGKKCTPFKVEMVIRGYLSGHAWRVYKSGERLLCGVHLPDGLKESSQLPSPVITPSTKADEGHDEDISKEEIIKRGIVSANDYEKMEELTHKLYQRGQEMASEHGLILVDTKYEFGKDKNGEILLIDEIHTPDSSRYFYKSGYEDRQVRGERQKQLSKEFVREWLMQHNFQNLEGETEPIMPDDFIKEVSERYIELFEHITGKAFVKSDTSNIENRIKENVEKGLNKLELA